MAELKEVTIETTENAGLKETAETAEFQENTESAEFQENAESAEFQENAESAEFQENAESAEFQENSESAEFQENAEPAEFQENAETAEFEENAETAELQENAESAEFQEKSESAEFQENAESAEFQENAESAEFKDNAEMTDLQETTGSAESENTFMSSSSSSSSSSEEEEEEEKVSAGGDCVCDVCGRDHSMGSVEEVYRSICEDSIVIEIHVSCEHLINKDTFSKSDPMVVMFIEERNSTRSWKEMGRTEVIKNNQNPRFIKPFRIDYHFEQLQKLKFEVYDKDCGSLKLKKHDFLGSVVISLGSLIGEYCGKVKKTLLGCGRKGNSSIIFIAEEFPNSQEVANMEIKAHSIDKKDTFGQSDPFLIMHRQGPDETDFLPIYQTEVIKGTLNPCWKPFELPVQSLCNSDRSKPIRIECYDWDSGTHDFIGVCSLSVEEMLKTPNLKRELINPKKRDKKAHYKNSGVLEISSFEISLEPTFLDFITTGGIDLCFHVAIDFTSSNGDPSKPNSLHNKIEEEFNQYIQALLSVGKICEDYDSDKLIPAYGFGAKINGKVSDAFNLNESKNPDCEGLSGVIEAYENFLENAEMDGPTHFGPVIRLVSRVAEQQKVLKKYHILMMLTDGAIDDMEDTKRAIIEASKHPVSIVIVGIGNASFDAMDDLDCDKNNLTQDGKIAERDIVQFVPFRKFKGEFSSEDLAKEVLLEVPQQLVSYMKQKGVRPQALNNRPAPVTPP